MFQVRLARHPKLFKPLKAAKTALFLSTFICHRSIMYKQLNKDSAKEFFEIYLSKKDLSLDWLQDRLKQDVSVDISDYHPDNLLPLWAWARKKICTVQTPSANDDMPMWYEYEVVNHPNRGGPPYFSQSSAQVIDSVAYYLGEVFIRSVSGTKWDIDPFPKSYYFCCPVILGDHFEQYPIQFVLSAARESLRSKTNVSEQEQDSLLLKWYNSAIQDHLDYQQAIAEDPGMADPRMNRRIKFK